MSKEDENIQVVVRCRGRNAKETNAKSTVVVHVDNEEGQEVVLNPLDETGVQAQLNSKVYKFNKVYGPMASQNSIFKGVASPMFDEFLKGYNCTLLVYGMTSSGKTYTMTGDTESQGIQLSQEAGIIPRVLLKLFDVLNDSNNNNDYIVKCSFVELYNEELKDLLSDDQNKKLKIFDQKQNSTAKNLIDSALQPNKSAIHIQNLEEIVIRDAKHGLRILQRGLKLRQVAATKMNDVSSRSHTIFTLNLFRQSKDNGELFRISKMNLVDLAGSENISRSGALNQRAKEAGSINQSLLTLGRVINLLVDKSETSNTHIPFRESKLTRLLQDSLGGRTKTCLIATISPAKINYEETSSTLEYAYKAKSIQNKPQLGSTLSKDILLRDLVIELSKAKADLSATRSKDGVYMDNANYQEIMNDIQEYATEAQENVRTREQLEKQKDFYRNKLASVEMQNIEYLTMINTLNSTVDSLHNKIDTQKQNEKNLITSSSKFKDIINNIISNLNAFHEYEKSTKKLVSDIVETSLKPSIIKISGHLKSQSESGIEKEVNDIDRDFDSIAESYQKLVSEACKNVTDSILSKLPSLFEDVEHKLKAVDNIDTFVLSLNEKLSNLSEENNNLKIALNESLFNNHQKIVENAVSHTYNQIHAEQQNTYSKIIELLNLSSSKQHELVSRQIKATVTDVVNIERTHLNPIKNEWNSSTTQILNDLDSESLKFKTQHQSELTAVFEKLKESYDFTNQSKTAIDDELRNVMNLSQSINDKATYKDTLKEIKKKFDGSNLQNRQSLDLLSTVNTQMESCKEKLVKEVVENSSKTNLETTDINQLINEIETEQSEIKMSLLPTGKTPKREIFKLPPALKHDNLANSENALNKSPPKFQLIGQRFDFTKDEDVDEDKENNGVNLPMKRRFPESTNRNRKLLRTGGNRRNPQNSNRENK